MRKGTISSMLDINYSSVQSIINAFEISGRTNKKQYLLMNYMQAKGLQTQKKAVTLKRGRKKLEIDNSLLFDAFGEMESKKYSPLKLFVDQETSDNKLKMFTAQEDYPYKLGLQVKELDIIFNDISKGDEDGNNSRDLFNGNLDMFNMEFKPGFNP